MSDSIIIIPTYNEKENIEKMVRTVFALPKEFHILVIDDGSPDGTGAIVKRLIDEFPNRLHLVERTGKLGLGTAYIAGFKWVLEHDYQYIFEMDADFSHPVGKLQEMYDTARAGADVVVGSRYVGNVVNIVNWPMGRLLMGTGLGLVLLCGVCNGFVRDGVVSWGPTILAETKGGAAMNPTLLSLVIPALNLLGMLSVRACFGRLGSPRRATGVLTLLCALMPAALAVLDANAAVRALLLGLCCAACYGVNPMLTTLIPMEYEPAGRVGLAAGLTDSFIYLGSALAGTAAGALSDRAGWPGVFAAWTAASVIGALLAFASACGARKIGEIGKN